MALYSIKRSKKRHKITNFGLPHWIMTAQVIGSATFPWQVRPGLGASIHALSSSCLSFLFLFSFPVLLQLAEIRDQGRLPNLKDRVVHSRCWLGLRSRSSSASTSGRRSWRCAQRKRLPNKPMKPVWNSAVVTMSHLVHVSVFQPEFPSFNISNIHPCVRSSVRISTLSFMTPNSKIQLCNENILQNVLPQ